MEVKGSHLPTMGLEQGRDYSDSVVMVCQSGKTRSHTLWGGTEDRGERANESSQLEHAAPWICRLGLHFVDTCHFGTISSSRELIMNPRTIKRHSRSGTWLSPVLRHALRQEETKSGLLQLM